MKTLLLAMFPWSPWEDILTFRYGDSGCLLQGRRHRITNAKRFQVVRMKRWTQIPDPGKVDEGLLERSGLCRFPPSVTSASSAEKP